MKTALNKILFALFLVLFGAIYEIFSHEVYSYMMIYAFVPCIILAAVYMILVLKKFSLPSKLACDIMDSGVVTISIGLVFGGIIEIYGTTNKLLYVYFACGALFILAAIITYVIGIFANRKIAHA